MYTIIVTHKASSKVPLGTLDKAIEKAFRGKFDGRGTFRPEMEREYWGTRNTQSAAENVAIRLKKIKGVRITVTTS